MRSPARHSDRDVAFVLFCIARMVDYDGYQKNRLLIKVLNNRTYILVQQGHRAGQAPNPDLTYEILTDPVPVECMAHGTCHPNLENIVALADRRIMPGICAAVHSCTSWAIALGTDVSCQGPEILRRHSYT